MQIGEGHGVYWGGGEGRLLCCSSSSSPPLLASPQVWDARDGTLHATVRPPAAPGSAREAGGPGPDVPVQAVLVSARLPDAFIVAPRSSQMVAMSQQGTVVRTFSSGKTTGGDFVAAAVSPRFTSRPAHSYQASGARSCAG